MYKDYDSAFPLRQAFLGNLWPNARAMNYVAAMAVFLLVVATAIRW